MCEGRNAVNAGVGLSSVCVKAIGLKRAAGAGRFPAIDNTLNERRTAQQTPLTPLY